MPDRYCSVPILISNRPSVSIGTDCFPHDFRNRQGLERSDSESDRIAYRIGKAYRIAIDPLQKPNGNPSGTIMGMILSLNENKESKIINETFFNEGLVMLDKEIKVF